MDQKEELKKILTEMMDGDLCEAIRFMESTTFQNNKPSLNIIITLSQILGKPKISVKLSLHDIKDLTVLCCTNIFEPNEAEINNYLRCLFHLIKYLHDKLDLSELTQICEYILPEWVSTRELTKDNYELIMHCCALVNNIIASNVKTQEIELLVKILGIHLQILQYIFPKNPKLLFQKIRLYSTLFQNGSRYGYFSTFCTNLYSVLDGIHKLPDMEIVKDAYNSFLTIIVIFFSNSLNKYEDIRPDIENTFVVLERLCNIDSEHSLCTEIFKSFFNLTVRDFIEYKPYDLILFKELRENCDSLLKTYGLTNFVITTFIHISEILRYLLNQFEKCDKDVWLTYMKSDIQKEYMKIFHIIGRVLSKTEYTDKCSKSCTIINDFTHAFTITSLAGIFMSLSVRYECENLDELHDTVFICIKDCCKYIEQLKLGNCERWLINWRVIASLLYNIVNRLFRSENYKLSKIYNKLLCTYIILLEGIENENAFMDNCLEMCLNLLVLSYQNMKQYRSALTYIALTIQICPRANNKIWLAWCNVKSKANNVNIGNIAELTIKEVLEIDTDIIRQIYSSYEYKNELMENLLFLELQHYNKIWASKIPMNKTCKQFFKLCDDVTKKTIALSLTWEKTISLQDQEFMENVENTITLINKIPKQNLTNQLCLSILHYIDFQYKSYEVLKRNLSEMNEAAKEEKPIKKPYEEHINPNDKCDVIPTYYNNKIENNMKLHKILNKSIELWNKILESDQLDTVKSLIEELNIDNLIRQTAFEYRLQNYRFQMLRMWFLYFQYGKLFDRKDIVVTSIGFILESINCKSETAQDMQRLAEKHIKAFANNEDKKIRETIVTYYVNKSSGLLKSDLLEEGVQELYTAENYLKLTPCNILEARILYLKCLYLQKPCSMKLTEHDKNFIVLSQNAFSTIVDFYKSGGNKCLYTLSVLFDISLFIGNMYKWLRMPREIRCYTSESVTLAQQMVLPLRTVQFFSLLAFTDLLGCQYDDCKVKLSGIDYMLCLHNSSAFTKNLVETVEQDKVVEISKELEKLSIRRIDNGLETMLDVPIDHRMKNLQGSPILQSKPFKIPNFIYHLNCNCFYCLNLDYLKLILECTHLEALFYLRQSNLQCSSDFFRGALKLYKGILTKYDSLTTDLFPDLISQFKEELNFTYIKLQFDYSFYYVKKRDYDEALKIVDNIIDVLGDDIKSNSYFYSEILLHKISLLTAMEVKSVHHVINNSKNELEVDYDVFLSKTPENKMSVAKISVSVSPCEDPVPKKNIKKHIIFDLFPSDDEKEPNVSEVKTKIYKMKTPAKTPAPNLSRLKIYTSPNKTKQNKIQPLSMSLSPTTCENSEQKKEVLKSPVDPKSKLKSKKILEKRTKLLTEKLKAEKTSVLKESNHAKVIPETSKVIPKSQKENRIIRTNLMGDLIDTETKEAANNKHVKDSVKSKVNATKINVKEKEEVVNNTRRKQYKKTIDNSSSSEDTVVRRTTRSVSKI